MRTLVLDPTGCGLGPSLGLSRLGHRLAYAGPQAWWEQTTDQATMLNELVTRTFEPVRSRDLAAPSELTILIDCFADRLAHLTTTTDPAARAAYDRRVADWLAVAARAHTAVIVDASDQCVSRESAFATLPRATLLAREVRLGADDDWQPFPFLYNNVLLWAEHLAPHGDWFVPPAQRRPRFDWAFCGTIDHARYRGRRRRAIETLQQTFPELHGWICETSPFVDVLAGLQQARCGLDLPGSGQLCFRLHEYLALGIPIVRPEPFSIRVPGGLAAAMRQDPIAAAAIGPEVVLEVYRRCYAPTAAAEWLLASMQRPRRRPTLSRA